MLFRCNLDGCFEAGCKKIVCRYPHYTCQCLDQDNKLPLVKLKFVKDQRERNGNVGHYNQVPKQFVKRKAHETEAPTDDEDEDANDVVNDPKDPDFSPTFEDAMRNYANFFNFGLQTVKLAGRISRFELSQLATSLLMDVGLVTEDNQDLIIDASKIARIQKLVGERIKKDAVENIKNNPPLAIGFDGKKDRVNFFNVVNEVLHPEHNIEEHIVMTQEPGGRMLDFFTHQGKATVLGDKLYDKIVEYKCTKCVCGIKGDSCNTNTGWEGGAIQQVEKRLDRPLLWCICDCHTTERPLHHLIENDNMSGRPTSGGSWKCPVMKELNKVLEKEITADFEPISVGPGIIPVSVECLQSLSEDQQFAYKICQVIRSGQGLDTVKHYKTGAPFLSRWYTIANRLCVLWLVPDQDKINLSPENLKKLKITDKDKFLEENLQKLKIYIEFITGWYYPVHFYIKMNPSYLRGPDHLLYAVNLLKHQRPEIQEMVWTTVVRGGYYGHSENILTTLLTSQDQEDREFAVRKTLDIRDGKEYGHQTFRVRNCPEKDKSLNKNATKIQELIDWKTPTPTESPFTVHLSTTEVLKLQDTPLKAPDLGDSHTQGVERLIQKVSKASRVVFSPEKLESVVRCGEKCSDLVRSSSSRTKRDLSNLLNANMDKIMKK